MATGNETNTGDPIYGVSIADSSIANSKLSDGAVSTQKIVNASVTGVKLANSAVDASKLASDAVTSEKIAAGSVTGSKIEPSINLPGNPTIQGYQIPVMASLAEPAPSILRGEFTGSGIINIGTGFSVTKNTTGDYTINFDTPFSAVPIAVFTVYQALNISSPQIISIAPNLVRVNNKDATGLLTDCALGFIIIGPK